MANENEIIVSITLDDGSIVQGLGKIKKELKGAGDEANKSFKTVGDLLDGDLVTTFTNKLKEIPLATAGVVAAVAGVGFAIKTAFDMTLAGEKLNAMQSQFQLFASQAGLNAGELQASLEKAAGGMVDISDLTQTATSAIINLGENANRLPQILDLARNSARALGGDVKQRFDAIVQAVETGNARLLRQQGIIIDVDGAIKRYKDSIGLTTGELTLAQRQQAILNAVLTEGSQKFQGVSKSVTPLGDALTQLKVALNEVKESTEKAFANSRVGEGITNIFQAFARNAKIIAGTATEADLFNKKIDEIQGKRDFLQNTFSQSGQSEESLKGLNSQLREMDETIRRLRNQRDQSLINVKADGDTTTTGKLTPEQQAAENTRRLANQKTYFDELFKLEQDAAANRVALTNDEAAKFAAQQTLDEETRRIRHESELAAYTKLLNDKVINQALFQNLSQMSEQNYADAVVAIQSRKTEQELALEKDRQKRITDINNTVNSAILSGVSNMAQRMGAVLIDGEKAWAGFGESIKGIIGDMLINIGQSMVATGIATSTMGKALAALNGAGAIAAGLGLIALGGALKAAAGQGLVKAASGGASSDGGGVMATPETAPVNIAEDTQIERRVQTEIVFNIQGDLLDAESTGSKFIDLINKAVDANDVKIRRGAIA